MYSSVQEYFTTMDFTTKNKSMWTQVFNLDKHHETRKENGVTYCAYSSNRKDSNSISVCYKYDTEDSMTSHRNTMNNLLEENREKWSALGDLDSIEFNHWRILCERTNDMRFDSVLNKTDDVFWVAKHGVEDKEKWVAAMKQQEEAGSNYDVRWWGLMENVSNDKEVSCVYRIPRDRVENFLMSFAETLQMMKQYATVDVNTCNVKFVNVEWENMYSMPISFRRYLESAASAQNSQNDEQTIRSILDDLVNKWVEDNTAGTEHMHEDCVIIRPSGNPLNLEGWKSMMNSEDVVSTYSKLLSVNKLDISGNMAWVCYTTHSKFSYKGVENDDIAVFSMVLKKSPQWKVIFMQRSTGRKPTEEQPVFA